MEVGLLWIIELLQQLKIKQLYNSRYNMVLDTRKSAPNGTL